MNFKLGLERKGATIWGFLAISLGIYGIATLFLEASREWQISLFSIAGIIPLYIAHKITCWIIAGFFSPSR